MAGGAVQSLSAHRFRVVWASSVIPYEVTLGLTDAVRSFDLNFIDRIINLSCADLPNAQTCTLLKILREQKASSLLAAVHYTFRDLIDHIKIMTVPAFVQHKYVGCDTAGGDEPRHNVGLIYQRYLINTELNGRDVDLETVARFLTEFCPTPN